MHAVTCPNCNQTLDVGRPVQQGRIRCRACGHVFVASTTSHPAPGRGVPRPQPHRPAQPAVAASVAGRHRRRVRQGVSPGWLILAGVLVLGILAMVVTLGYYHSHPYVKIRDPVTEEVLYAGRMSQSEAEAKRQRVRAEARRRAQARRADERGQRRSSEQAPAAAGDAPSGGREPVTGRRQPGGGFAEPETRGDEKIRVTDIELSTDPLDTSGFVTGEVRNDHDAPVTSAEVTVTVYNRAGAQHSLPAVRVTYIPSGQGVRFSVRYDGLSSEDFHRIEAAAAEVTVDPDLLCVSIPAADYAVRFSADGMRVRGRAQNRSGQAAHEPRVVAEILAGDEVVLDTVSAELEDPYAQRVGANEFFSFELTYERPRAERADDAEIRLVGRRGY
ncbi:MAG: FxLYD domain-containing protein [Planctomycetota bacterium]